jgi:membrane-associated phospholipid phosphatase
VTIGRPPDDTPARAARRRAASALAVLLAAALPLAARAERPRPIRYDLRVDGSVAAAAVALWIGAEIAKPHLGPSRCRICDAPGVDVAARDAFRWDDVDLARNASHVLAYGLVPAGVVAHQLLAARAAGETAAGLVDLLVVLQTVALAADLNHAVKHATGRARPFVREHASEGGSDPDDFLAFYSGHASVAFALASASGTVSSLRGYRSAPWVWGLGMALAATTGYLRIAGDEHHLTDVLAGAAAGTAAGIALPRLLHGREGPDAASAAPLAGPRSLGIVVAF